MVEGSNKSRDDSHEHAEIGRRLQAFRLHLGLSPTEFCKHNGFSRSQYSNWESGHRRISIDAGIRLAERYGLDLDFIYRGILTALPHTLAVALSESPLVKNTSKSKV